MRTRDIKDLRDQAPFKPLVIHLTSGRSLPVLTADHLMFSPREDLLVLFPAEGGICVIDPGEVASVDVQAAG